MVGCSCLNDAFPVTAVSMKITAKEEVFYRGQQMELECLSGSSNPKSDISWKVGLLRFALKIRPVVWETPNNIFSILPLLFL